MMYQDISIERKPFVWRTLQEHNDTESIICRNSVQGKMLIVDDRGNHDNVILLLYFLEFLQSGVLQLSTQDVI